MFKTLILPQFAVVNNQSTCGIHWIPFALLLLLIGAYIYWYIVKKHRDFILEDNKLDLVSIITCGTYVIVLVLFTIFRYCAFCNAICIINYIVWFVIVLSFLRNQLRWLLIKIAYGLTKFGTWILHKLGIEVSLEKITKPVLQIEEVDTTEHSLKESMASARLVKTSESITKKSISKYLKDTYGKEIEAHEREDSIVSKTGKGGVLPLSDNHFTLKGGNRVCFTYVYNIEGSVLILVKANMDYYKSLKKYHKLVTVSKFPKSNMPWLSIPVDDTWTSEEFFSMLDDVKAINEGEEIALKEVSKPIVEKVDVLSAKKLMSDEDVKGKAQKSERVADTTRKAMINIDTISEYFKAHETVTLEKIKERVPDFDKKATYYKVCARGTLNKPLIVDADDFSTDAEKMILLTGGKVIKSK